MTLLDEAMMVLVLDIADMESEISTLRPGELGRKLFRYRIALDVLKELKDESDETNAVHYVQIN